MAAAPVDPRFQIPSRRVVFLALALVALFWFARPVMLPFVVGAIVAYAFSPAIDSLQARTGRSRLLVVVMSYAAGLLRKNGGGERGKVVLLHVVESGGARVMGDELADHETHADEARLAAYAEQLRAVGIDATWDLGFGDPATALTELVGTHQPDLVVVGSHGHGAFGDLFLGTSIERLRHRVKVPVVVVPTTIAG